MPEDDRGPARRGVLQAGAAALAAGALPFPAASRAPSLRPTPQKTFAGDVRLPGLLHAVIARPPLPGWRLAGVDADAARTMPGVVGVIPLDSAGANGFVRLGGVAVLARDRWSTLRARDALRPVWIEGANVARVRTEAAFLPRTAEPLMEPPCATARLDAGRCAVWTPTDRPDALRRALAVHLDLEPGAVAIHPTASACGQGPPSPGYAVEAALLSRAMGGAPVSLIWTAEDDFAFRSRPVLA